MKVTSRFLVFLVCVVAATIAAAGDRGELERDIRAKVAAFLEQQKEAHGADAVGELKETKSEIQDDGTSHFWFEQVHDGVPVLHAGAMVHTIKGKGPFGHVKVYRSLSGVPTTPSITLENAAQIAAQALGIRWMDTGDERLVIVPRRSMGDVPKQNVLAWSFLIGPQYGTSTVRSHWYIVNAVSGEILLAQDATREAAPKTYHGATPNIRPYFRSSSVQVTTRLITGRRPMSSRTKLGTHWMTTVLTRREHSVS
jgi:Zn-dependent metalloprotease